MAVTNIVVTPGEQPQVRRTTLPAIGREAVTVQYGHVSVLLLQADAERLVDALVGVLDDAGEVL